MKVLHSKTTAEPILLVSACPTMNLFAIVTHRAVVVYRATTLTALVTIALANVDVTPTTAATNTSKSTDASDASLLQACWTPSGSLLTLALTSGVVLLIDVESGELIRRLVPTRDAPASTFASQNARPTSCGSTGGVKHALGVLYGDDDVMFYHRPQTHTTSATEEEQTGSSQHAAAEGEEDADEEVLAYHRRCRCVLWRAPVIPLSTVIGEPICALSWVRVPTPSATAKATRDSGVAPRQRLVCPPLQNSISAPLLAEMGGVYALSNTASDSADRDARGVATSVLVVLDAAGTVSLVLGGLYEVDCLRVQLPSALHPRTGTMTVRQFSIVESPAPVGALPHEEIPRARASEAVVAPEFVSFADLSTNWLASRLGSGSGASQKGRPAPSTPSPLAGDRPHSHYGVLHLGPRQRRQDAPSPPSHAAALMLLPLSHHIRVLTAESPSAALCYIGECTRVAETCRRTAAQRWQYTLRVHTRRDLQLPEKAALLHDALVEEVAQPNPAALLAYYQSLPRERLRHAKEVLETTLASIGVDMLWVVQNCQRAALQVAQQQQRRARSAITSPSPTPSPAPRKGEVTWSALIVALARQQQACESWAARVKTEALVEANLAQWVLQRASLTLALEGLIEEKDGPDGSPIPIPPPLPVAQHPSLLRALVCIQQGKSTAWDTVLAPSTHDGENNKGGVTTNLAAEGEARDEDGAPLAVWPASSSPLQSRTRSRGAMECSNAVSTASPPPASSAYHTVESLVQRLWASEQGRNEATAQAPLELVPVALGETMADEESVAHVLLDYLEAIDDDAHENDNAEEQEEEEHGEGAGNACSATVARPLLCIFTAESTQRASGSDTALVMRTSTVAPPPCRPASSPRGSSALAPHVSAVCTRRVAAALAEVYTGEPPQTPLGALTCFTTLGADRHLLLFASTKADQAKSSAGVLTAVVVQSDGHVEVTEADDEDDAAQEGKGEEHGALKAAQPRTDQHADDEEEDGEGEGEDEASAAAEKPAVLTIPGLEAPLLVAVSRSREFSVVASQNKFVLLDLFKE